jgi:hypothetical protein
VDKTRYIEMLEREANPSQFFIRPRKFGKNLFFTTLLYYYNMNEVENFDALFGNLYIGKHPTPKRNSYAVMYFDFSGVGIGNEETFRNSFSNKVKVTVKQFLERYKSVLEGADRLLRQIKEESHGISVLENVFLLAHDKLNIFVIIDEYDQFANDLIANSAIPEEGVYKTMMTANGLVRDFYEQVKIATKTSTVSRTFITGISPVMIDDMTSGYNIATNYTLKSRYNEMLSFTREEVEWMMNETGVDPALNLKQFISYISENAFCRLSDHDLQRFDEKYIKILLLAYLFMDKTYVSMSEYETVPGRADIFLQRNPINPYAHYE